MTKKKIIGLVLWFSGTFLYFFLKDDVAALISALLIAASIPLLVLREKKPIENQDD